MQAARLATRLQREVRMLQTDPPPGACAWPCNDSLSHLEAQIQGPEETVYAKGIFKLEVRIPDRYPFEPPNVRFTTPVYHPNIDSGGRICLDILNMPPKGAWKPSLNIPTLLASIGLLLAEPNPDDGLMGEITEEYKHNRASFDSKARMWTQQYAMQKQSEDGPPQTQDFLRPKIGEHEQTIETTAHAFATHFSFDLGFSEERKQEIHEKGSNDRQPNGTGMIGPISCNQKLNLSMKLSLDKGAKVSERHGIADTEVSAETLKRPLAHIDNTHATRLATVKHDNDKSSCIPRRVGFSRLKGTMLDHDKSAGTSRSKDSSLQRGTVDNAGIIALSRTSADSSRHLGIDEVDSTRPLPAAGRSSNLPLSSSIVPSKVNKLREDITLTQPLDRGSGKTDQATCIDEVQVIPKVCSPSNGLTVTGALALKSADSISENGGHAALQSSSYSSKLSSIESLKASAGRTEAQNLCREFGKTPGEDCRSATTSVSSGGLQQNAVHMNDMKQAQKIDVSTSKVGADSSKPISIGSEGDDGLLSQKTVRMDSIQGLASDPGKFSKNETSKEISGQLEVNYISRKMAKRWRGSEKMTTLSGESLEILNQTAVCLDSVQDDAQKLASKLSRVEKSKERSTTALAESPAILMQMTTSMDGLRTAEAHAYSTSSVPTLKGVETLKGSGGDPTLISTSGHHKFLALESAKAGTEAIASTMTAKRELAQKAVQSNPASLIVLDSESDDEPPKGRSRLSLAKRKNLKGK